MKVKKAKRRANERDAPLQRWVNDWKAKRRNRELIKTRSLKRGSKGEYEPHN